MKIYIYIVRQYKGCQLLNIKQYCLYSNFMPLISLAVLDYCFQSKSIIEISRFVGYLIHWISQKDHEQIMFSYFVHKQFLN